MHLKKIVNIKQKYPNVKLANTFVNKDITQALFDELKDISRNLSNCNNLKLKGKCKEYRYIPATTDENLIMDLDNISKLIISRIYPNILNIKYYINSLNYIKDLLSLKEIYQMVNS